MPRVKLDFETMVRYSAQYLESLPRRRSIYQNAYVLKHAVENWLATDLGADLYIATSAVVEAAHRLGIKVQGEGKDALLYVGKREIR